MRRQFALPGPVTVRSPSALSLKRAGQPCAACPSSDGRSVAGSHGQPLATVWAGTGSDRGLRQRPLGPIGAGLRPCAGEHAPPAVLRACLAGPGARLDCRTAGAAAAARLLTAAAHAAAAPACRSPLAILERQRLEEQQRQPCQWQVDASRHRPAPT